MTESTGQPIYRITDLHEAERPRERLASLGPEALSSAELLAILLRVGVEGENAVQVGQRLLQCYGGLAGLHRGVNLGQGRRARGAFHRRTLYGAGN